MAIPKDLEPLLEGFTEDEIKTFDSLLTKQQQLAKAKDPNAPTLTEGWLRQSDYDRNINKMKSDLGKAQELAEAREKWYAENKPIHDAALQHARELESRAEELETHSKDLETQYAELQKKLSEAEQRRAAEGGEPVDAAELERRVQDEIKKFGYVSRSDMDTIIQEQQKKLAEEEKLLNDRINEAQKKLWEESFPLMANHSLDIAEIGWDHKAEFNENLDREAFTKFLVDNKITDFKDGYSRYVKPRRDEILFTKRVDEEVKQKISGMTVQGALPVQGAGIPEKGALQVRLEKERGTDSTLAAAAQAAAELRSEGKF